MYPACFTFNILLEQLHFTVGFYHSFEFKIILEEKNATGFIYYYLETEYKNILYHGAYLQEWLTALAINYFHKNAPSKSIYIPIFSP